MLSLIRHQEIFDPHQNDQGVTIIGAGAIGSHIFASLVCLGLKNITVYDPDTVASHNLSNQLFVNSDIGNHKTLGLYNWAVQKLGTATLPFVFKTELVTAHMAEHELQGTVFLLVDSLETRRILATAMSKNNKVNRVVDVRMAATHGNILVFYPKYELDAYLQRTTASDEDAELSACGSPFSVLPTAQVLSNIAVWQFIHAKTNVEAHDKLVNVFLKPLTIHAQGNLTRNLY